MRRRPLAHARASRDDPRNSRRRNGSSLRLFLSSPPRNSRGERERREGTKIARERVIEGRPGTCALSATVSTTTGGSEARARSREAPSLRNRSNRSGSQRCAARRALGFLLDGRSRQAAPWGHECSAWATVRRCLRLGRVTPGRSQRFMRARVQACLRSAPRMPCEAILKIASHGIAF